VNRHAKASSSGSSTRQGRSLGATIRGAFATRAASAHAKGTGAPTRLLVLAAAILAIAAFPAAASAAPPTITIDDPITTSATTTAHVSGEVAVPADGNATYWCFEYAEEGVGNWSGWCYTGPVQPGESVPVDADLTGLHADKKYEVRLAAQNLSEGIEEFSTATQPNPTFTTDPAPVSPSATLKPVTSVSYTSAQLQGAIDPEGGNEETGGAYVPIHWSLQLSPSGDPGTFNELASGDLTGTDAESKDPVDVPATPAEASGLTPGHTYTFRLVATYAGQGVEPIPTDTFETEPVAKPTVSVDPVTTSTDSSAHLVGHVNPGAPEPEGSTSSAEQAAFETSWHFECVPPGPSCGTLSGTAVPAGNQAKTVEADATGLEPNKAYYVKLIASNLGGESEATTAATPSFTTGALKPTVRAFAAGPVQSEAVDLNGEVNPHNAPTTYWFEWGTSDCSANPCTETPHLAAGVDELQGVRIDASAGQFTLTFAGDTTPDLPFDASVAEVQAALQALPSIGAGNVSVSPSRYRVAFKGDLANTDVQSLVAAEGSAPLTKNEAAEPGSATVEELTKGNDSGPFFLYVTEHLTGLSPNTTYHFRLVAENASGTTEGDDEEFTTAATEPACANAGALGTDTLPNCRAYEMVSPPDKNGQDVITQTDKTHVASDGDGVTFSAIGGFGEQQGTSYDSEFISRRTAQPGTNGWATSGINPKGGSTTFVATGLGQGGNTPSFMDAFTPDLSAAIYRSWRPLTDAPNVAAVTNLYRIDGLGSPGASAELMSDGIAETLPAGPAIFNVFIFPSFVAASTDLSHVLFESKLALTDDAVPCAASGASGCPLQLYENADGAVRFVGRVPAAPATECDDVNGPACVTAPSSEAGISASLQEYSQRMISADGSRILFQTPADEASGNIYLREDGERTYQLNVSESEPAAEPQPAQLWEASRDGSRVFFTTFQRLVAEDEDSSKDLYMYEVEKPAGHRLTLVSASTVGEGGASRVIGASDDGRYVYFFAFGQLVPGAPDAPLGIYVWHDGDLSYIGEEFDSNIAVLNGPRTPSRVVGVSKRSHITPDGRHLLFMTEADAGFRGRGGFAGYEHPNNEELYLYSADSGRLQCASCNPSGAAATVNAVTNVRTGEGPSSSTPDLAHALSDDGRYAFFSTAEKLLDEDTNGQSDAYAYDSRNGQVHLLSSGTDPYASYLIDASDDGANAFFATRERLSGWDRDDSYDLYDARVGGGLPEPAPVPDVCSGDSCPHPVPAASAAGPTTSKATGPGNPPRPCRKGTRRVVRDGKVRCLKKKPHHKKHNRRRAGAERRAGR
jgi:hypothetical protein